MWSAIIAGVITIAGVLYMLGPIAALALTAASSLALLIIANIGDRKTASPQPQAKTLDGIDGKTEIDVLFPKLRQRAS